MTLEECYAKLNEDYQDVLTRLVKTDRIARYLCKLVDDTVFEELFSAVSAGDCDTAFRAAHTIKGEAGTLGLKALASAASTLTEALRGKEVIASAAVQMTEDVKAQYTLVAAAIREYCAAQQS